MLSGGSVGTSIHRRVGTSPASSSYEGTMVPLLPWVCDVSLKDGLPGPLGEPWLATLQISMKFREHIEAALALASSASGRNL